LDRLFEIGVTEIFAHVVSRALGELDIEVQTVHLDSTSFSLAGDYQRQSSSEEAITITHSYSRDRRPELKQAVVGLICEHRGGIPVWLNALDGNGSDSASFPQMVEAYIEQFKTTEEEEEGEGLPTVVADSAL
jgi:transposase